MESSGAVEYSGGPVKDETSEKTIEEVHFHAGAIEKPDESTYFNSPKDQKRRAKEKRKHIKAEVKRILKDVKAKKHDEAAEAKKALRETDKSGIGQKKQKTTKLFRLRILYITFGILLLLAAGAAVWLFRAYIPNVERDEKISLFKKDLDAENKANIFLNQVITEMLDNPLNDGKDIERALESFDAEIQNASREEKIFLEFAKVSFSTAYVEELKVNDDGLGNITVNEKKYEKEIKRFSSIEALIKTDYEKKSYYKQMISLYVRFDKHMAEKYEQMLNEIGDVYCNLGMEEC